MACGDGGDGALYCFERADGTTRWRYDAIGESYATAITDGERAYAVNTDGILHAVELANGKQAWTYDSGGSSYERPTVMDGTVYVASTNGEQIAALDAASGEQRWMRHIGVGSSSAPALTAETVFFTTSTQDGKRLFELDPVDGTEHRRHEVPENDYKSIQPVIGDGVVYLVAESPHRFQSCLYAVQ